MTLVLCFGGMISLLFLGFVETIPKMSGEEPIENELLIDYPKADKKLKIHFKGHYDPELIKALQRSPQLVSPDLIDKIIPDHNKIIFPQSGVIKMFFLYRTKHDNDTEIGKLKPASEMLGHFVKKRLQNAGGAIKILDIHDGSESPYQYVNGRRITVQSIFSDKNWEAWQLAVLITASLFAIFCMTVVILFISSCRLSINKVGPVEEPRHVVVQPVLRPAVAGVGIIQPENRDQGIEQIQQAVDHHLVARPAQIEPLLPESDSENTPSPSRSPMRRGRGLLERRGSNASLTLDLNRSQENIHCGTPPKECSAEEYLQSASKRLTRRQLRSVLRDVKALHTEFWEIPMNHPEKVEVAGSGTKNRYKTILPNENTRVSLYERKDDPLSSYINANYVRGYGGEVNAYIATQGPLPHTVDDFWLMIWKERSPIIVMITKLKEKLKVKCEPYIPDYQDRFGDVEVTVIRVIPREGYTIRELFLRKGSETHTVHHFWYTTWPDHKTPETAKQLLAMALEVEGLRRDNSGATKGPMIVHCSAGIGRTGCFIAASIGIQQLLEENSVDVLGIVCSLRIDRGGMIQTAEQYEFVHQALSIFEVTMPGGD
ncbi:tyrosine-protein phosphatase non-receptor type 5 isoform X2 [Parasteatoda tepidariorum]|uniref:tyrosine-protein phosphatase non-receptor type 5 isoform X2 n=1 Tax=Parasteatoda tepidariorum TaxID=114398 RepID=UPI0039BD6A49